jgi:hypothetical protein
VSEHLSKSSAQLVPERLFLTNSAGDGAATVPSGGGLVGQLLSLLVSEKAGMPMT